VSGWDSGFVALQVELPGFRRPFAEGERACLLMWGWDSGFVALQAPKAVELPGFRRPIAEGVLACLLM